MYDCMTVSNIVQLQLSTSATALDMTTVQKLRTHFSAETTPENESLAEDLHEAVQKKLVEMPGSSEYAALNAAEHNDVSVRYRCAASLDPSSVQVPQEFMKLKELENIVKELRLKTKEAKSAKLSEEHHNKCLHERASKLAAEMQEKAAFIRESENWRLSVAVEAERLSEVWNTENGKKLLADARLSENAHQVRALEREIEYTRRFIERKKNAVNAWQNSTMPLLHKEELLALENENSESARKIVIWQKENSRLALILDAMKEMELEMQFAVDRCYQRKKRAQDECHRMKCRIVYLSSVLDNRLICKAQSESGGTEPPSECNDSFSSTEYAGRPQHISKELGKDEENTAVASFPKTGQETQLSLHIRRANEMRQQEQDSEETQREYSTDQDRDEAGQDDLSGSIDKDDLRTLSTMLRRCSPGLIDQMHFRLPPYENF